MRGAVPATWRSDIPPLRRLSPFKSEGRREFMLRRLGQVYTGVEPCHPSVPPDTPKGRDRGEELEQSPNAAQAALEERGQAAGELSRASLDGFFSAGGGWAAASHMPADTAQCSASAMTNRSRAKRSAWRIWLSSRPNPLDLKSENIALMPQRKP